MVQIFSTMVLISSTKFSQLYYQHTRSNYYRGHRERECVVYWYSIQKPLHYSGYASRSRVMVCMICVCLYVNVWSEVLGLLSPWISGYAFSSDLSFSLRLMCVCFITAGPITKLCACGTREEPGTLTQGAPVFHGSSRLGIEPKTPGWLV